MTIAVRYWNWEEAFDKFGFGDGDGEVHTHVVVKTLERQGYCCTVFEYGLHNTIIESIEKNGEGLISTNGPAVGYDNPRDYLPTEVVALLDAELPPV